MQSAVQIQPHGWSLTAQYRLLFLGTGLLGLQTSAMEGPHLPLNPQDRLSFSWVFFRPFCFSPLKVFTPALLCHPNYLHRELHASHPSIPNTAQTEQRSKKHFPFVHFKQWCSHHGCKPLVNKTYRAKHPTLKKKKELIKKSKLNTRSVFIPLAPFN